MFEPGSTIAERFRVRRKIGEGGMGAVYECENIRVGKRVAVKVLTQRDSLPAEALDRFEREANAPSKIGHPAIVDVFDAGIEDGVPWMAMELLEGETLQDVLRRERVVQPPLLAKLMDQLLAALTAAHAAGFVHRDLKPANIFLAGDPANPLVKLLDFGIAKALGEDSHTRSKMVIGTPAYMSPEQMRSARGVTARSDLWSIGVILYECLVGFRPFRGDTIPVIAAITGPGTHVKLHGLSSAIHPSLSALVDRLLSKDVSLRPVSASALREELLPLLKKCSKLEAQTPPADPEDNEPSIDAAIALAQTQSSTPPVVQKSAPLASPKTVAVISVAGFALLMGGSYAAFSSVNSQGHSINSRPALPRPQTPHVDSNGAGVNSNNELRELFLRWNTNVHDSRATTSQFSSLYADAVQFHGANGLSSPGQIKTFFRSLFSAGGTLEMDWSRSTFREKSAELSEGVPAACINAPGAIGKVFEVRAHARELRTDRSPEIGCPTLEGVYLFRLRRVVNTLRICHETWSLREGICSSCPTARACSGQH